MVLSISSHNSAGILYSCLCVKLCPGPPCSALARCFPPLDEAGVQSVSCRGPIRVRPNCCSLSVRHSILTVIDHVHFEMVQQTSVFQPSCSGVLYEEGWVPQCLHDLQCPPHKLVASCSLLVGGASPGDAVHCARWAGPNHVYLPP